MRLAILSDIHSNLPALEAVLASVEEHAPDAVWCLADVVGYGARPDECCAIVAERCDVGLAGNHDLGVLGEIDISSFSPAAAEAAEWTREHMGSDAREYLAALPAAREDGDVAIYHASPRDHVWEYVLWPEQAAECMRIQAQRVSLVGHSHVALCFREDPGADGAQGTQVPGGATLAVGEGRWLLNPGSVGQPRDGDPRAAWMLLDTEAWTAEYVRVDYDVEAAGQAILDAGLPEQLARRLAAGQ
jgi:predicted phosphodiesterase